MWSSPFADQTPNDNSLLPPPHPATMAEEDRAEDEEEILIHRPEDASTTGRTPEEGGDQSEMMALSLDSEDEHSDNLKVLCCDKMFLIMAASTAAIGGIMFGYDVGVISGALLQLRQEFHLSCNEQAILVSFLLLGATIGAVISGFLVDFLGRKLTIILNGVIFALGSVTLALAHSFYILVSGRLLLGCAVSISAVAECIYISEIAPAKRRGLLVSLNELGITLGLLLSYLINFLFINVNHGWRYMFGIAAFPAIFQIIVMFFLPKSPHYLLMKGKEIQAARILKKLHGPTVKESQVNSIKMALLKEKRLKFKHLFQLNYNMRGRLVLGIGLVFFQQFTGQPNILYYAPVVFQAVGFPSDSTAELATLGLGTIKVTAAIISLLCVDYWGRRTFLIIGASAMSFSLLLLSIGAQIQEKNFPRTKTCASWEIKTTPSPTVTFTITHPYKTTPNNSFYRQHQFSSGRPFLYSSFAQKSYTNQFLCHTELIRHARNAKNLHNRTLDIGLQNGNFSISSTIEPLRNSTKESEESGVSHLIHIITILALLTYVGAYGISFGPITWIILSEIYPPELRGRAIALVTVINWAANFFVSSMFLKMISIFTLPGTFFLFSGMSVLSVVFVFCCIPETKNKSLEQISKELSSKKPFKWTELLKHPFTYCNFTSHNFYSMVSTEDQ